jgi:TolA-binding protein
MTPQPRLRRRLALLACLPLTLAACGGGGGDPTELTNQGYAALGSGDTETAVDRFAQALKVLQPGDPGYKRARMGECEAKARIAPDAAARSFLAFAQEQPGQVDAGDYHKFGMQLSERKALADAVAVLGAGLERFPDDPKIDEAMKKTQLAAEQSGDTGALDALRGFGYAGGGDR